MLLFTLIATALGTPATDVGDIHLVQHFELATPMTYHWLADAPSINTGTVIVVSVAPEQAMPRQTAGPTLFVGSTPAAVTHPGYHDGRMVVFVPGHPKLESTPVFWANSDLPERLDETARQKLSEHVTHTNSISPQSLSQTNVPIKLLNERALYSHLAGLIERYAPNDADFAHGYRLAAEQ